jgi:nucleoside 2-deoxyribosyltransferase
MQIYLAGPDVFLPDARTIGQRKRELCIRYGVEGLFPLDNQIDITLPNASLLIFRGNEAMMDKADAVIANLTPFRGPSADAGTVYELGYMAGRGKLVLGYSNDPAPYAERVGSMFPLKISDGRLIDHCNHVVEDFGRIDNLMIVHALDLHGYPMVTPQQRPDDLWYDLSSFEACVRLVAERGAARALLPGG